MIDVLFVLASRIEQDEQAALHLSFLERAVQSIECYFGLHANQQIMIVDSDSPYRAHIPFYQSREFIRFEDAHNKNYEAGAWRHAYYTQQAAVYVFMHDSCMVTGNFSDLFTRDLTIWKPYKSWKCIRSHQKQWVISALQQTKWRHVLDDFVMVQGSIFCARRKLLDMLYTEGLQSIAPQDKDQAMGFERLLGNVLTQEGYRSLMLDKRLHLHKTFVGRK